MLTSEKCLSVDLPLPSCVSESFGLASDDTCHFTTRGMEHAEGLHIRSHQTKRVTGALDGTCIGLDLFKGAFVWSSWHNWHRSARSARGHPT